MPFLKSPKRCQLSNEKRALGCLGYIESKRFFFVAQLELYCCWCQVFSGFPPFCFAESLNAFETTTR